ncbi:MAG: 3-demethylubiquinone-9 3-O-methyltransferase [Planctomycetes bacterium]|nr:3-demethylubiquinone-9 3-O-methyltransferase [Planctomycetota bacterium]
MSTKANDLTIYERRANEWWDPRSPAFRSLHSVNRFRVELLFDWLGRDWSGRTVIDVGCGGGLLAAPLSKAGARVIGLDLSHASLRAASERIGRTFVRADLMRVPLASAVADVVLLADVLEHVENVELALREASRLLVAGGVVYVNTINRTRRAKLLAVDLAEGVGLVPRGTHDARLFVEPDALRQAAWRHGLVLDELQGERVDLWKTVSRWAVALRRSDDLSVGYSALFRKAATL